MTTVKSEDMSALIDGELSAERAAAVRAAIAADPALHADYEALVRLDMGLARFAEDAAFAPMIVLPSPARATSRWAISAAVLVALLIVRFLPKFAELALMGFALQTLAAAAVLIAVMAMARDHPSMAYRRERGGRHA